MIADARRLRADQRFDEIGPPCPIRTGTIHGSTVRALSSADEIADVGQKRMTYVFRELRLVDIRYRCQVVRIEMNAASACQKPADMPKAEERRRNRRHDIVSMRQAIGDRTETSIVSGGECRVAGTRHAIGINRPHARAVGGQILRGENGERAAETVAGHENGLACAHDKSADRRQRLPKGQSETLRRAEMRTKVEIGYPVREHDRIGPRECDERRLAASWRISIS